MAECICDALRITETMVSEVFGIVTGHILFENVGEI